MSADAPSFCPSSTYRIQLRSGTDFRRLTEIVDFFDELGIGALYLSPFFRARSTSTHGYDVVDYAALDPECGTGDELAALAVALRERNMALVADFVPNHMSASAEENPWWRDVLEAGPRSPFARVFDVDWGSVESRGGKLRLPLLGAPLPEELEAKTISLTLDDLGMGLRYHEHRLPLAVATWLAPVDGSSDERLAMLEESLLGLAGDGRGEGEPSWENWKEKQRWKRRFVETVSSSPRLRGRFDDALAELSSQPSRLREILDRQHYELVYWREARGALDFRRFFDIDDLIGIRVEDPEVFGRVHETLFRFVEKELIQGLRIDHVDGLLDPARYLEQLPANVYRIVEKILEPGEALRTEWPIDGTTGYEAMNLLHRIFVDPASEPAFQELYRELTGVRGTMEDAVYESKKHVLETSFRGELARLAARLAELLGEDHGSTLKPALTELVARFPVYRTYVGPDSDELDARDRDVIDEASRRSAEARSDVDRIAAVLKLEAPEKAGSEARSLRREIVLRFQQLTGPVMAKGLEDTAFYRFHPLVSLNEVGSGSQFGVSVAAFHEENAARLKDWPASLTATATHDTKRGEDVRARLAVLSERPDAWREAVARWMQLNRERKRAPANGAAPDANEEYFLYQTLLGTWPLSPASDGDESRARYRERIQSYMRKALREAKRHTSWIDPEEAYEDDCLRFVASILDPSESGEFLEDFERFEAGIRRAGLLNGLSQLVLKATVPGIPDFYQGTELWDLDLVDPDNRRPVDFAARSALAEEIAAERATQGAADWLAGAVGKLEDGRVKLALTRELCRLRRSRHELFVKGGYTPLSISGERADHAIAFARSLGSERLLVAVGRFFTRLGAEPTGSDGWKETKLRLGDGSSPRYREIVSGRTVSVSGSLDEAVLPLAEVFRYAPFAVLEPES